MGENLTFYIEKPPNSGDIGGNSGCGGRTRTYDLRVIKHDYRCVSLFVNLHYITLLVIIPWKNIIEQSIFACYNIKNEGTRYEVLKR